MVINFKSLSRDKTPYKLEEIFQLIQKKLADMEVDISLGLLGIHQVSRLKEKGLLSVEQISMMKRNNCMKAIQIARDAR